MAFARLRRMRLNEPASEAISSRPRSTNSGASMLPRLTSLAIADIRRIGFTMTKCSSRFSSTIVTANTANNAARYTMNASLARSRATRIGTETICAPITSPSFQPKPLAVPYRSIIEAGAADGVEWQVRQFLSVIRIGREIDSSGPVGRVTRAGQAGARGVVRECADDAAFPVGGAIGRIGRVQRRFLVGVVGELHGQGVQIGLRRPGRHGVRQEADLDLVRQQRLDLLVGVVADRGRHRHHDGGLLEDLAAGVLVNDAPGQRRGEREADQKRQQHHQIELGLQTHPRTPLVSVRQRPLTSFSA